MKNCKLYLLSLCFILIGSFSYSQEEQEVSAEALAKKLANPVASLISVPLQNNFDFGVGPLDGFRYNLNIQPVIPISLSDKWNMISLYRLV